MALKKLTYIEAISEMVPYCRCVAQGNGSVYEEITRIGGDLMPTKEALDVYISDKIKIDMWKLIQAERDRRKAGGVKVGDNWFHSDDTSRIQQLGLVMMGANMPNNIMWKTMSGSFVQMTPTLAGQIFQSIAASDMTIFSTAEQKRAEMMASAVPENYNYLIGWPLIYGE